MSDRPSLSLEMLAGAIGGIPWIGGALAPAAERGLEQFLAERRRNSSRLLALACEQAGQSREDLAERLYESPETLNLATRMLYTAAINGQDEIIEILAGYLGTALADPSSIDDVHMFVGAMGQISGRHIQVLERIAEPPPSSDEQSFPIWNTGLLQRELPYREEVVQIALTGLVAVGFIADIGIDGGGADQDKDPGGTLYEITLVGQGVLDVLRDVRRAGE